MTKKTANPSDTPLIRQYLDIKAQNRDAILFFRMGDFYEMFFDDAEIASRELGLTLTTRNNGGAANVPLAGVPVKAGKDYLRRLVERGHRVAICEQIEDPKQAKGIVKRAVTETITPGSALTDDLLEGNRNNFLVAIAPGELTGLAALDISTGEFFLEVTSSPDALSVAERYGPREIVVPVDFESQSAPESLTVTRREKWEFDPKLGAEDICERFKLRSLDGLGIEDSDTQSIAAAAALLRYVQELQPGGLPQISRPLLRRRDGAMLLDRMTQRNLELVENLRGEGRATTLLSVLDQTQTPMGGRLLRQWLAAPLVQVEPIVERHDAVDVYTRDENSRRVLREALDGVRDIERLAGRAAANRASPRELGALRDSLGKLPDVASALNGTERSETSALLQRVQSEFDTLSDLQDRMAAMLVERPPVSIGDADSIAPGADQELDEIREIRDGGKQYIANLQARERERTGVSSLKVGFNRVFGYYIEITKTHRDSVPDDYERRQTLSNAERFVTPELKDYEARVLGAEDQVLARERFLLNALSAAVHEELSRLQVCARHVAILDVLSTFAYVAVDGNFARPEITDGVELDLQGSRHPVVERMLPHGKFIPNDIKLDLASRVILLTGPNMAGKSTVLRQVGLCVVLAQIGSFVPADSASIGVVDRVFTRVGASDDLGRGQSTFMVEMNETSAILHSATDRSLILLDEIGRGTSTYDGVAIAWAVTEHIHDQIGAKTIFATHYHELTQLTEELSHACNFNVAVRESGEDIIFLHRLQPGGADRSYGIHVGRIAGLPERVVGRAWGILKLLESGHHVAGQKPPPPEDAGQLGLFQGEDPLAQDLRALDLNTITPIEALNQLAALKRRAEEH